MIADGKGGAATLDTSKDEPAQGLEERRGEERRRQTNKHNKESIDTRRQPAMALVGPLLAAVGGIGLSAYASSKFRNRVPKDTLVSQEKDERNEREREKNITSATGIEESRT